MEIGRRLTLSLIVQGTIKLPPSPFLVPGDGLCRRKHWVTIDLMGLPHADRAEVDLRKLSEYCLSPVHPVGKHKAAVFQAALG